MMDLIEAIEKAEGPGRMLDALIEVEVRRWQAYEAGLNDDQRAHWKPVGTKGEVEEGGCRYHSPTYTFEIDRALLLVPGGWQWQVSNRAPKPRQGRAYINNKELLFAGIGGQKPNPKYRGDETTAATPALALCAAALRVRSGLVSSHQSQPIEKTKGSAA
jgi:hypothetical protein